MGEKGSNELFSAFICGIIIELEDKLLIMKSNISDYKLNEIKQYENNVVWMNYKRLEKNQ